MSESNGRKNEKEEIKLLIAKVYDKYKQAVRNNKIIVSYIKLNSTGGISNDGGIMILTASLLNPNTIQDDTNRVIKEYREQIMRQITAIEKGDPHHHGLQELIRKELMKNDEVLEEGEDGEYVTEEGGNENPTTMGDTVGGEDGETPGSNPENEGSGDGNASEPEPDNNGNGDKPENQGGQKNMRTYQIRNEVNR